MTTYPKSILKKTVKKNHWHFEDGNSFYDRFDVFYCNKLISSRNFDKLPSFVKKITKTPISEGEMQIKKINGDIFLVFQVKDELIQYQFIGNML